MAGWGYPGEPGTVEPNLLRVGLASADVTAPVPFRMSGGFRLRVSTGMHDPLRVRAMVLRQGDGSVAIATCDLLGVSQGVGEQARRQAAERTGLNPEHIVIAATHTHTGPLYYGARHDYFRRMAVQEHGEDPFDSTAYRDGLVRTIADTIATAFEQAVPAALHLGNVLRETLGEDLVSLFNSGTSGDINHVDVSRRPLDRGHAKAERIGTRLGNTVVAALDQARTIAQPSLAAASTVAELPRKHFSQQQIAEAHAELAAGRVSLQVLEVIKVLQHQGPTLLMRVQAVRLDAQTALVAMPSEIFVELGLAIKERSPFEHTLVLGLASGPAGYIPTEQAFEQGSYEPTNSRIQPGGGELLVEAALGLLQQLYAE